MLASDPDPMVNRTEVVRRMVSVSEALRLPVDTSPVMVDGVCDGWKVVGQSRMLVGLSWLCRVLIAVVVVEVQRNAHIFSPFKIKRI